MGTDASFIEFIVEQACALGPALTHKKMFGEYALYVDDKVVAFVCDNQVFLKPTDAGRPRLTQLTEAPPYPGAKMYWLLGDELDDRERLSALLRATADALPAPKPKAARTRTGVKNGPTSKKAAKPAMKASAPK